MPTLPAVERRTIELAGLSVPFVEVTGSADGPTLTVIAGVHGCEYASMDGVRRWLRTLEHRELRGRVRAVPVLNVTAFAARTPFVVPEDGKNLNRSFPGDPAGTLAERLAYDAFTQLITGSDAYVDAHCGDLVEALQPFALYEAGPAQEQARELAAAYGLPYVIRQPAGAGRTVNGTSSASAAAAGIPAITAEAGGCGLVEEDAVALHIAGLDGVLAWLGMTAASQPAGPPPAPTYLGRFLWPRCAEGGWWAPAVKAGDAVRQGQVIGTISSLDGGRVHETITAPADGVVIFVTSSPAVADDGLLLGLGADLRLVRRRSSGHGSFLRPIKISRSIAGSSRTGCQASSAAPTRPPLSRAQGPMGTLAPRPQGLRRATAWRSWSGAARSRYLCRPPSRTRSGLTTLMRSARPRPRCWTSSSAASVTRLSSPYPARRTPTAWSRRARPGSGVRPVAARKRCASVSTLRQPRLPQGHGRPLGSTLMWPASMDRPVLPVYRSPRSTSAPPTPRCSAATTSR